MNGAIRFDFTAITNGNTTWGADAVKAKATINLNILARYINFTLIT